MDRELLQKLNHLYKKANLDVIKATQTWADMQFTPERIATQVRYDINRTITTKQAEELHHLGASLQDSYEIIAKDYEVSKGREDLIPENIKQDKVKLSPAIRMAMDRVGANLFRHKTARTYWTMKEKLGDNGAKEVYLVAVDDPDDTKKEASVKIAGADLLAELATVIGEKWAGDPNVQQAVQQYGQPAIDAIKQNGQAALNAIKQNGPQGITGFLGAVGQQAWEGIQNVGQGISDYFTGGQQ